MTGLRKARSGRIRLYGSDVLNSSARHMIESGVSHVPEDRLGMGLVGNLSISDNTIMKDYRRAPLSRGRLPRTAPPLACTSATWSSGSASARRT